MLYIVGFVVACFKLLVSGITIYGVTFSTFGGAEFATVVGALGAIYVARNHSDNKVP